MTLQVIGAGLPRTGTSSLRIALAHLFGGDVYHMSVIPGHPFDLGKGWNQALSGDTPDWDKLFKGYGAAVDWPASHFWRALSAAYPDALVLLSVRDSAETWWQSAEATILPVARRALAPEWDEGRGLVDLFERFTGSRQWDNPAVLQAAYRRHNSAVRETIPRHRLLEWQVTEGWSPICQALGLPVPDMPFPWVNRRADWS
jgi:hypothetical protein